MIFQHFSAYGLANSEAGEKIYSLKEGFEELSSFFLPKMPRELHSRTFSFMPLLVLSIKDICASTKMSSQELIASGILCGSFTAGGSQLQLQFQRLRRSVTKMSPLTVPMTIYNSGSSALAIAFGCQNISAGYHCAETSGLVALCDAMYLIEHGVSDFIFVTVGEQLKNLRFVQVGGAVLISKCLKKEILEGSSFTVLVNRGKPYLPVQENVKDAILEAKEKQRNGGLNQKRIVKKWGYMNFQDQAMQPIVDSEIQWVRFPQLQSYLSLSPFLAIQKLCKQKEDFNFMTVSSEGHIIVLEFMNVESTK